MAEFGEMPELIADGTIELTKLSYDHTASMFTIGDMQLALRDENIYDALVFGRGADTMPNDVPGIPVFIGTFGSPVTTPKFYSWLTGIETKKVFDETATVIRDTFSAVHNVTINSSDRGGSVFGADVYFLRPGHLSLQTIGNCACLGVSVGSMIVDYEEWDRGYAAYEFHNIDWPAQYISLMAGLGHLAALCEAETKI